MECYEVVMSLLPTRARALTRTHTQVPLHRTRPERSSGGPFSSVHFMHACRLEVNIR
jgi:hypothetical protein